MTSRSTALVAIFLVAALPVFAAPAIGNIGETWRFNNWVYGIGIGGFWPVDVDSDGDSEIVYGLGNGMGAHWAIADYAPTTHDYTVRFKSALMNISALRVVEVGNQKTIWVAGDTDGLRVYNLLTQELVATLTVPPNVTITALEFGDGNNDGTPDVVALAQDRMLFFNAATYQAEPTISTGAGFFALGNVDDDPDREIVLSDGRVLRVNGAAVTTEWERGTPFGFQMRLADIDGDSRDELIASQGWGSIQAWNLDSRTSKWERPTAANISAVRTFDITGDGVPEVFYGDAQWGGVHALSGNTGNELWTASNPEYGVTDILVSDPDDDGTLELVWGAGSGSTGPDYVYVVNAATRAVEYQSFDISNNFPAADVGDVDNDGRAEIVVASSKSNSDGADGVLLVFDALTHALEYRSNSSQFGGQSISGVQTLKIANVDADPQAEIVVVADRLYDSRVFIIDGITHAIEKELPLDTGSPLSALDVADVDGDGQPEVITANYGFSNAPGQYLYVVDPRTGAIAWKSASLGPNYYPNTIHATDVGAPGRDLLVAMGKVLRVRWSDKQQTLSDADTYLAVLPLDVTGNSELEIVAGRYDGTIDVLDGETLAVLSTHSNACVAGGNIPGVRSLRADGPGAVAYTCNGAIMVYDLASSTVTTSVDTGLRFAGVNNSLVRYTARGKTTFLTGGEWPAVFTDLTNNGVPAVDPLSGTVHWRGSTDLTITGSDPNGDALTYQVSGLPSLGIATLTNATTGTLHYAASGTAMGADSFLVRAFDGYQYSVPLSVALTLTNTPPTAPDASYSSRVGQTTSGRVQGTDPDGDPLTYVLVTPPARGTMTLNPTGTFTYVLAEGTGSVTATVSVRDGVSESAPVTVTFNPTTAGGSNSGGGGGGGSLDLLFLALLGVSLCFRLRRAESS